MTPPKSAAERAEKYAINWTKPRLPEAELHALKHAWLAGHAAGIAEAGERIERSVKRIQGLEAYITMSPENADEIVNAALKLLREILPELTRFKALAGEK